MANRIMTTQRMASERSFAKQIPWRERVDWGAAGLVTVAIVLLHLYFLSRTGGFWRDEVNLIRVAQRTSLAGMASDSCPLLMPLLVRAWIAAGLAHNEIGLRLLGGLIGLAVVAAFWLGSVWRRQGPPWFGLAFAGMNSVFIIFGDSVRAYGLGALTIALAALAAVGFVHKPSWSRAGFLALAAVLSVQSLYHNAILVGAICLGAVMALAWGRQRTAALQAVGCGAVAALSLLPYWSVVRAGRQASVSLYTGFRWPGFLRTLGETIGFPWSFFIYVWLLLAAVSLVLAVIAIRRGDSIGVADETRSDARLVLYAAVTLSVGVLGFVLFLAASALPIQMWYFVPLIALAAVCFDLGWPRRSPAGRWVLLGLGLATSVASIPADLKELNCRLTNIDLWGRELTRETRPGDLVVVTPWHCGVSFGFYYSGAAKWATLPPVQNHSAHAYDEVRLALQSTNSTQTVFEQVADALQSGGKVWIVAETGWLRLPEPGSEPPPGLPPAPLTEYGWNDRPYTMTWTQQLAYFLRLHSLRCDKIDRLFSNTWIIENMELYVAEGFAP